MIYSIQVRPYWTNNGCSLSVGKCYDATEILYPDECIIYLPFIETEEETMQAINLIKKLPNYFRNKEISIEKLKIYKRLIPICEHENHPWQYIKNIIETEVATK